MKNTDSYNCSLRRCAVLTATIVVFLCIIATLASAQNNKTVIPQTGVQRTTNVTIGPKIPKIRRVPQLVILERADDLYRNEGDNYMTLVGQVEFTKGGMRMYTDSAHYYDSQGSFNAFGNVRMFQGDTLSIYADELNYDGPREIAYLFGFGGKPVRLRNRDVSLETDIFTYNMLSDLCYYTTGGVLTDRQNRLTSVRGEYSPATKEANFYDDVVLTSVRPRDSLRLENSALYYNTYTHIAQFSVPTVITNKDGVINSDDGIYNTETRIAQLFDHSKITTTRGSTLEGDTLMYDRKKGYGQAWGNMALIDPEKQTELRGNYGYYNEIIDSAFVTGHAVAKEYSKGDTLYIHGRYLKSILRVDTVNRVISVDTVYNDEPIFAIDSITGDSIFPENNFTILTKTEQVLDSTHIISAWPRVRMYRNDVQGLCDSLVYTQADSLVHLYHHPIIWNEDRQIFGNIIELHVNDSTVDRAVLPDFGFMAQQIEENYFNQLTGKTMKAWFINGDLDHTLIEGSVQGIVYPEENDSTINKLVNFRSANLEGYFDGQQIKRMKLWNQTDGEVIPLYLAKYGDLLLPQFKWYTGLRPYYPGDIFDIPAEMNELMSDVPEKEPITIPRPPTLK